jgi:hypothetical protein
MRWRPDRPAWHALCAAAAAVRTRLSYEYTVRVGDGSSRVFREELPVSWRLGERLIVIDGARSVD